jgi:hypothetical protein
VSGLAKYRGHAFLSYCQDDAVHADRLQRALTAAGIPVWRDTAAVWPGDDKRLIIRSAIADRALAFLACFSRLSQTRTIGSHNEELGMALEQLRLRMPGQPWLIPVRFGDCAVPDIDIGFGRTLSSLATADLFGSAEAESMAKLVVSVRRILGPVSGIAATPPVPSAAGATIASVGPKEAACEAALALMALDDAGRFGGSTAEILDGVLSAAADTADWSEEQVRSFRARIRSHGLDPRLLIAGMDLHQEAVRRWADTAGGGGAGFGGWESAPVLLAALSTALGDAVRAGNLANLSADARRYLSTALLGDGPAPPSDFYQGLSSYLPPLRSSSREVVLVRSDDRAALSTADEARDDESRKKRQHGLRLSSVARQMCQLPQADPNVVGRGDDVTKICARTRSTLLDRGAATAFLSGQPGVGTSTVAIEAARELSAEFAGGVLYLDLHGLDAGSRRDMRTVVRIVSEALGFDLAAAAHGDDEMVYAFTSQLSQRRVLLVLDNARDAAHAAPLAQAPMGCAVMVTSRDQLQGFADPSLVFRVEPLQRKDSVQLLAASLVRRPTDLRQLDAIAELCADIPLALRIMGGRMASRPDLDPGFHLKMLSQESARLPYLTTGDRAVRTAIRLSYDNLDEAGQQVFRLIPAAPGSSLTGPDLGQVTGESAISRELLLIRLADRSLAAQATLWMPNGDIAARFTLYSLVRLFALERLIDEVPADEIRAFRRRFITVLRDQLIELTDQVDGAEVSGVLDPARFHAAEALAEAESWLDLARDLASSLYVVYRSRKELDSVVAVNATRLRVQLMRGDYDQGALSCLNNADDLRAMEAMPQAIAAAREGREIASQHGLPLRVAEADFKISVLLGQEKDWRGALDAGSRAVEEISALGQDSAAVDAAINNSLFAFMLGSQESLSWGRRAAELADQWGNGPQKASAYLCLGRAEARHGSCATAVGFSKRAHELFEEDKQWWNAGVAARDAAHSAETIDDLTTAVEQLGITAEMCGRSGRQPWQIVAFIDLSALQARAGSFAAVETALANGLGVREDKPSTQIKLLKQEILVRRAVLRQYLGEATTSGEAETALDLSADLFDDEADSKNAHVLRDLRNYSAYTQSNVGMRSRLLRHLRTGTWNVPDQNPLWIHYKFATKASMGMLE